MRAAAETHPKLLQSFQILCLSLLSEQYESIPIGINQIDFSAAVRPVQVQEPKLVHGGVHCRRQSSESLRRTLGLAHDIH